MSRCERGTLERLSPSQARMGRGSTLSEHFLKLLSVNTAHIQMIALCFHFDSVQALLESMVILYSGN